MTQEIIDKDEVLKMAEQSNLISVIDSFHYETKNWVEEATAFAKLVAAKAVEREREECAKVADECTTWNRNAAETIAAAIRARGFPTSRNKND